FLSRVIGYVVDRAIFRSERAHGPGFFITTLVAQLVLGVLASIIVAWFSRQREFRADAGGASLAGRDSMIGALERLKSAHEPSALPDSMKAFGISGGGGMARRLFATHPPLDERIKALRSATQLKFG
ncbi:MAG: M48 family metalloprotease, partial [Gammaproteobacteria bacterium]|nr:M48 family metalloprotease [Gammaproteobacteria bacterium]